MAHSALNPGLPPSSDVVRVRATQSIVSWMGFCWSHPSLTALEVAWRWVFGVPFLLVVWGQYQQILLRVSPDAAGLNRLNGQNPWTSAVVLAHAAGLYEPAVAQVLGWLVPVGLVAWAVVAGVGRTLLLARMYRLDGGRNARAGVLKKMPGMIVLQGVWIGAQVSFFYLWYCGVSWAGATHVTTAAEPDLVGYLCWLIFISLGLFVLWGVVSWVLAVAPVVMVWEGCSLTVALGRSFRLGKALSSKLVEINLVMAIVRIALIVLGMVFCAAPLPFSDEFGPDFLHFLYGAIVVLYLIANDYFQVVRLRSFASLRGDYRQH